MAKSRYFRCGWNRSLPDKRDFKKVCRFTETPDEVILSTSPFMPPIWNQSLLGSCVGQASGAAFAFDHMKEHGELFIPSRLFIYYNARELENSIASDDGCQIRDAVKQLVALGACKEDLWGYEISKFSIRPPKICYKQALKNQVLKYQRVGQTEQEIESVLAEGYPVIFGMTVYSELESTAVAKTGILPMPDLTKEKALGGHAVLIVGYNKLRKQFLVRNSWGEDWGQKGYFWIDYAYVLDSELCDDFWCLSSVE